MEAAVKEPERVTVLNQREGKLIVWPDADELKLNPKAKSREIPGGRSLEVSAEDAKVLLSLRGVVDASTIIDRSSTVAEISALKAKLASAEAENEKLRKVSPAKSEEPKADEDAPVAKKGGKK